MLASIRQLRRRCTSVVACTVAAGALVAAAPAGATVPAEPGASLTTVSSSLTTVNSRTTMEDYMTDVVTDVGDFWNGRLTAAGKPSPFAYYNWISPGQSVEMQCVDETGSHATTDATAAYCPKDDTIYFSVKMAQDIWNGALGQPGVVAGGTTGDFSVAYAIAHEYAHNVQRELGIYDANPTLRTKQFELQADCMAGVWANSAYWKGALEAGDVEEAITSSRAVGDEEFSSPAHHGTPQERADAFMLGYNTGDAGQCSLDLGNPNPAGIDFGDLFPQG